MYYVICMYYNEGRKVYGDFIRHIFIHLFRYQYHQSLGQCRHTLYMILCDVTRHDVTRRDTMRHDAMRHDATQHDAHTRHDATRRRDTTRHATT